MMNLSFQKKIRRSAAVLLVLLLTLTCLTGCAGLPSPSDILDWFGPHLDLEPLRVDSELPLYDLTSLTDREERLLCTAAIVPRGDADNDSSDPGSERLLLVSRNAVDDYVVETLDLSTGEFLRRCSINPAARDSSGLVSLRILSTEPFLLLDETCGVLYRQEGVTEGTEESSAAPRHLILSDEEREDYFFCSGGELYASSTDGKIWKYDSRFQRSLYWTLPSDLTWIIPQASPEEGIARFLTYRLADRQTACTLSLSLADKQFTVTYTDREELPAAAAAEGLIGTITRDRQPAIGIYDTVEETQRSLLLPVSLQQPDQTDEEDPFPYHPDIPSCGLTRSACILLEEDGSGMPGRILLWFHPDTVFQTWRRDTQEPLPGNGLIAQTEESSGVSGDLLDRASELSDTYGVRILLGTDVPQDGFDYTITPCTDEKILSQALTHLEDALALYPEGYFETLRGSHYRDILIMLTGALTPVSSSSYISNAGAFSTEDCGLGVIAADASVLSGRQTLIHEITHITDYRLLAEGLLDEEAWNSMNPEGFSYYEAYLNEEGESYETAGSRKYTALDPNTPSDKLDYKNLYFVDSYSKTWPMEDRARLMEYLMLEDDDPAGAPPAWYAAPHMQEKTDWYLQLLRRELGTEDWPEQTEWEKRLSGVR